MGTAMLGGGGGNKGGQQTSEIPSWLEGPAKRNLQRAEHTQQLGHMDYRGPDVAAFSPMQERAFENNHNMANAFGLGSGGAYQSSMPQAQDYGGFQAYSAFPMFDQSRQSWRDNSPMQAQHYDSLFGQGNGYGGYGGGSSPATGYYDPYSGNGGGRNHY